MKPLLLVLMLFSLAGANFFLQAQPRVQTQPIVVIPEPVSTKPLPGEFKLDQKTTISLKPHASSELQDMAKLLSQYIASSTGIEVRVLEHASSGNVTTGYQQAGATLKASDGSKIKGRLILLEIDPNLPDVKGEEGYKLRVNPTLVVLRAIKPAGLFYGLQTLRQLWRQQGYLGKSAPDLVTHASPRPPRQLTSYWAIPAVDIVDYPRFAWRGLMLDVSRHFFSKEYVKTYIDQLAMYKFNVFHWHLSDDQGWRIEIKALPRLTNIGAWRVPRTGKWWSFTPPQPGEKASYGGFYTQEDIKEVVAYANKLHVEVLPEIDVPGHSLAAIAAYPYLSATDSSYQVNPGSKFYQIDDNTLNPIDERVYAFLDKVFAEIAPLFPCKYIHMGGDECTKVFWHQSASIQAFMKKNGMKSEEELQSYFVKRVEKILQSKGKSLIGWDEILEGGLPPEATVMSWRGTQGGINAAKQGHHVIMTPADSAYLDLYQGDPALEPDTYSMLRLKSAYNWCPVPAGIKPELILGGQGNLWTESVPSARHAEYMTWPRGLALSEVFWSSAEKHNWKHFQQKLPWAFDYLNSHGINYSQAAYDILVSVKRNNKQELEATLETDIDDLNIFYTLDNTNPDAFSLKYEGKPVVIPQGIYQLRAVTYQNGRQKGKLLIINRQDLEKRVSNGRKA